MEPRGDVGVIVRGGRAKLHREPHVSADGRGRSPEAGRDDARDHLALLRSVTIGLERGAHRRIDRSDREPQRWRRARPRGVDPEVSVARTLGPESRRAVDLEPLGRDLYPARPLERQRAPAHGHLRAAGEGRRARVIEAGVRAHGSGERVIADGDGRHDGGCVEGSGHEMVGRERDPAAQRQQAAA